jgi:hypothetical protein
MHKPGTLRLNLPGLKEVATGDDGRKGVREVERERRPGRAPRQGAMTRGHRASPAAQRHARLKGGRPVSPAGGSLVWSPFRRMAYHVSCRS